MKYSRINEGDRVRHPTQGEGTVFEVPKDARDLARVLFDSGKRLTLCKSRLIRLSPACPTCHGTGRAEVAS